MFFVQRGTFKPNFMEASTLSELIDFDYMGSAEFEFGALPSSRIRISGESDRYGLFTIQELQTPNHVPFHIYCDKHKKDEIVDDIKAYIDGNNPKIIINYRLKEHINLAHMYYGFVWSCGAERDNFWWDIQNDFMCFYGAADRMNAFMRVINQVTARDKEFFKSDKGREALDKAKLNKRV